MANKVQAQAVKTKLEQQYSGCSFGLGKDGDNWTVELRDSNNLTVQLPGEVDGVKVRFRASGPVHTL